jgi:DNA ligase 1
MEPMLATKFNPERSVRGWLLSEKLDGIRAIWTGEFLMSRNFVKFDAPEWFTIQLPKGVRLDGELYIGRGCFQKTLSAVTSGDWSQITYRVFDAPQADGGLEQRLDLCRQTLSGNRIASVIHYSVCRDASEAEARLLEITNGGGEGVILRKPGSRYESGKSKLMVKYKRVESAEGTFIESAKGAFVLNWNGVTFKVGTQEIAPSVGSPVTFSYSGLTDSGKPKCAKFVAVRNYE